MFDEGGESEEVHNFIITNTAAFARVAVATPPAELNERIVTSLFADKARPLAVQVVVEASERTSASAAAIARPTCSSVALPPASSPSTALASRITTTLRPGPWQEQVKTDEYRWAP